MMTENWKPMPRYEATYMISDHGRVASLRNTGDEGFLILKPRREATGYLTVGLWDRGHALRVRIHRMVWGAHVGTIGDGMQINHVNGDKEDNRLCNLEACTPKQNSHHARDVLGKGRGENCHKAILTELEVGNIRKLNAEGVSYRRLSSAFGVNYATIAAIIQRRSWKHIP